MAPKYSKTLAATALLTAAVALTYCSPNTSSLSKELLHERAMSHSDGITPQISEDGVRNNTSSNEVLTLAKTSWLDESDYSLRTARIPLEDSIFDLSTDDDSAAKKLEAFRKTGKLEVVTDSASADGLEILLKVNVESMDDDQSLAVLSTTGAGQVPISITPQGEGKSLIRLDLSGKLDGVQPELKDVQDVSLVFSSSR